MEFITLRDEEIVEDDMNLLVSMLEGNKDLNSITYLFIFPALSFENN
jgi:hypothetical protein